MCNIASAGECPQGTVKGIGKGCMSRDLLVAERAFAGLRFVDGRCEVDESVTKAVAQRVVHSPQPHFDTEIACGSFF